MSLYIPFDNYKGIGGPITFMGNLKNELDKLNFQYSDSIDNNSDIFFPIEYNLSLLNKIKTGNGKVIQRLDGIYYPSKHGKGYKSFNYTIRKIYQHYADYIIFQSEYSKKQCFSLFGNFPHDRYSIIYNGVNKSIFSPPDFKKKQQESSLKFITTGNFRNIDMIEPIVKALDELSGLKFTLQIVGPIPNKELLSLIDKPYIIYEGSKSLHEVSELLRASDIFIYSHLNPPCPNSVVEAISCGLPIVGFDSGAMRELCFFSPELLAHVSNDVFQRYEDFDYKKLLEKLLQSIHNLDYYRDLAFKNSNLYSFEECGKKYIEVFDKVTKNEFPQKKLPFLENLSLYFSVLKSYIRILVKKLIK